MDTNKSKKQSEAFDGLHEEWKNAEIEGWFIDDEEPFILSVIK